MLLKNFQSISILTDNKISVEEGILVRMTDKINRIATLIYQDNAVKDEKNTRYITRLSSLFNNIKNISKSRCVIINLYYIYTQNNGTRTEKNWKKIREYYKTLRQVDLLG